MRVSIGKRRAKSNMVLTEFDRAVATAIFSTVNERAVELTKRKVVRLAAALRQAAMTEAYQLLLNAADILFQGGDARGQSVRGESMAPKTQYRSLKTGLSGAATGGVLPWAPLTLKYSMEKFKHFPANINRTLVREGYVMEYLLFAHKSVVETRFGGIEVSIGGTPIGAETGPQALARSLTAIGSATGLTGRVGDARSENYRQVINKIKIKMFPRIAPALLPGLASRRWTDTGNTYGAMERATLPAGVANKLAPAGDGAQLPYRPLILPLTQFWMLVRIPNAIGLALRKFTQDYTS